MARLSRVVVPDVPHHVTQRGNRRQPTFFCDEDYQVYRRLLAIGCRAANVEVLAYCLMPNHVHLILVPSEPDGLRAALAEAHRRYSSMINKREGWTGYLWQGRFASAPMDERHLLACTRYVELNPVRARLVVRPQDWPWSSPSAHLSGQPDGLVSLEPMADRVENWAEFLAGGLSEEEHQALRAAERTGRPLGSEAFQRRLESDLNRPLLPRKPGPAKRTS